MCGLRNFVVLFCPGGCTGSQVAKSRRRGDGGLGGWEGGSKQGEVRKAGGRASDIEIRATDRKQIERKE